VRSTVLTRSTTILLIKPVTVYVAPQGFERELIDDVETLAGGASEVRGRLVFSKAPAVSLPWAQCTWRDGQVFEIESISDAARKLRALKPFWHLHSSGHHRRATLIQEQLPKLPKALQSPLAFLGPATDVQPGAWTLLEPNRLLASADLSSPFADGEVTFHEDKKAPSRAYLKLWELFTIDRVRPEAGVRCLDLGASPGGWTYVLASIGCEVLAVDRAELAPEVARMPGVTSLVGNAFTLKPADVGPVDWLFSDLICYPEQLFKLVQTWLESGMCKNFVCTIKFKGPTDHLTTRKFAAIPGSRLRHLSQNKHELTWWLTRDSQSSSFDQRA
jgi:23S rRNA (cytidine2498-2'-O)-methyltransferase